MTTVHVEIPPELLAEMRAIREDIAALRGHFGPPPEYLTTEDVARVLKCSPATVRKRARDGEIEIAKRHGKQMLFHRRVVEAQ